MRPDLRTSIWQFLLVAAPIFLAGWCLVSYVISHFGWQRFAARYPAIDKPQGHAYNVAFFNFGSLLTTYRNVARIVFTPQGIYFRMVFLFRPFHPPFLVPWSSVTAIQPLLGLMDSNYYEITVNDQAGRIQLQVHKKAERDLLAYRKTH